MKSPFTLLNHFPQFIGKCTFFTHCHHIIWLKPHSSIVKSIILFGLKPHTWYIHWLNQICVVFIFSTSACFIPEEIFRDDSKVRSVVPFFFFVFFSPFLFGIPSETDQPSSKILTTFAFFSEVSGFYSPCLFIYRNWEWFVIFFYFSFVSLSYTKY